MKKLFRSLQAKYMLIILTAIFIIQFAFIIMGIVMTELTDSYADEWSDTRRVEEKWHQDAGNLPAADAEAVRRLFLQWKEALPEASMFWVDGSGHLAEQVDVKEELPETWTPSYTASFIKKRYGGDPFTVIALLGTEGEDGFLVLEVPRDQFEAPLQRMYDRYEHIFAAGIMAIIFLFVFISYLFFRNIRNRLLALQTAMENRDGDGLPVPADVKKDDEVGCLEQTFNQMVRELRESKKREQEEERLRRELIANLSHDLRTPLTKLSAHIHSLGKEKLSENGRRAIEAAQTSIRDVDRLIENLMAYTLLMASKLKQEPRPTDIVRFVREQAAAWYPVFEKEGFVVDVELSPLETNPWEVDPVWMGRIFDNLLQNVLRHAKDGKYLLIKTESAGDFDAIVIADRGKGMGQSSGKKGAGIGLTIVDMMVKGMDLDWEMETGPHGTTVKIKKYKNRR